MLMLLLRSSKSGVSPSCCYLLRKQLYFFSLDLSLPHFLFYSLCFRHSRHASFSSLLPSPSFLIFPYNSSHPTLLDILISSFFLPHNVSVELSSLLTFKGRGLWGCSRHLNDSRKIGHMDFGQCFPIFFHGRTLKIVFHISRNPCL